MRTGTPPKQASGKPQINRIIPEKMFNSGTDRKYTKMTGNETPPSKQTIAAPPARHDRREEERGEVGILID